MSDYNFHALQEFLIQVSGFWVRIPAPLRAYFVFFFSAGILLAAFRLFKD